MADMPDADTLRTAAEADLDELDRRFGDEESEIRAAMAPWEQKLSELRAQRQVVATERRRRERAENSAKRKRVQQGAKSGEMPTLEDALASADLPEDLSLRDVKAFLATGGAVGFGFATRPGAIAFTDGQQQKQATTWGEARGLYEKGWTPGSPTVPGVRVHMQGTRVERVLAATGVVVDLT